MERAGTGTWGGAMRFCVSPGPTATTDRTNELGGAPLVVVRVITARVGVPHLAAGFKNKRGAKVGVSSFF